MQRLLTKYRNKIINVASNKLHTNTSSVAHGVHDKPGLVAKRIIDCVGRRMR